MTVKRVLFTKDDLNVEIQNRMNGQGKPVHQGRNDDGKKREV